MTSINFINIVLTRAGTEPPTSRTQALPLRPPLPVGGCDDFECIASNLKSLSPIGGGRYLSWLRDWIGGPGDRGMNSVTEITFNHAYMVWEVKNPLSQQRCRVGHSLHLIYHMMAMI